MSEHGAAAAELARDHRAFIYRVALGILGHHQDSEDATQDVLVRVVRFSPGFESRSAPRTWLYRITYNVCMTRLHERRRAGRRLERTAVAAAPEHSFEGANDRLVVREAVRRLPVKYRAPVALFFFAQLSHLQIAHRLGMPVNTVKVRIHRGKALLRASLGAPAAERR